MLRITKKRTATGSFADYIPLGKLGVKLLKTVDQYENRRRDTQENALQALRELNLMQRAFEHGLAPRPYGFIIAQKGRSKRVGLLVEHLEGVSGEWIEAFPEREIQEQLEHIGIIANDTHSMNVIYGKDGQYKVVDFSPELTYFI